jgi:hypothetical protein
MAETGSLAGATFIGGFGPNCGKSKRVTSAQHLLKNLMSFARVVPHCCIAQDAVDDRPQRKRIGDGGHSDKNILRVIMQR